jgi:hypothetical protein
MDMSTGLGIPLRGEPGGAQGKNIAIKRNDRGEPIGIAEAYEPMFNAMHAAVVAGRSPLQAYLTAQKDELLSKDKLRLIHGESFFLTILGNMYFGDAMDCFKDGSPEYHSAVGINAYDHSAWRERIMAPFKDPASGDSRRNDIRQNHFGIASTMHHLASWYDDEFRMARETIIGLVLLSPRMFNWTALFLDVSLPSGSFITTIANTMYTLAVMCCCWAIESGKTAIQAVSDLKGLTYGDDSKSESLTSSRADVTGAYVKHFWDRFGMEFVPTADNVFLGRDANGALDVEVIRDIVRWTRSESFADVKSRVASYLVESYMLGPERYEEMVADLRRAMDGAGYLMSIPSYDKYKAWAFEFGQSQSGPVARASDVVEEFGEPAPPAPASRRDFLTNGMRILFEYEDERAHVPWYKRAWQGFVARYRIYDDETILTTAVAMIVTLGACLPLAFSTLAAWLWIFPQAAGEEYMKWSEYRDGASKAESVARAFTVVALPEILGKLVVYCFMPHGSVLLGILLSAVMHLVGPVYVRDSKSRAFVAAIVHTTWNWLVCPAAAAYYMFIVGGGYLAMFLGLKYVSRVSTGLTLQLVPAGMLTGLNIHALWLFLTSNVERRLCGEGQYYSAFGRWLFGDDNDRPGQAQSGEVVTTSAPPDLVITGPYTHVEAAVGGEITTSNPEPVFYVDPVVDSNFNMVARVANASIVASGLAPGNLLLAVDITCALAAEPALAPIFARTIDSIPDYDVTVSVPSGSMYSGAALAFLVCQPMGDMGYRNGSNVALSLPGCWTEDAVFIDFSQSTSATLKCKWSGQQRGYDHLNLGLPGWGVCLFVVACSTGSNIGLSTQPLRMSVYASLARTVFGRKSSVGPVLVSSSTVPTIMLPCASNGFAGVAEVGNVMTEADGKSRTRLTDWRRTTSIAVNAIRHIGGALGEYAAGAAASYALRWSGLAKPADVAAPTVVVPGIAPGFPRAVGLGTNNVLSSDPPSDIGLQSLQAGKSGANTDELLLGRPGLLTHFQWSSGDDVGTLLMNAPVWPSAVNEYVPSTSGLQMYPTPLAVGSMLSSGVSGGWIRYDIIVVASSFSSGSLRLSLTPGSFALTPDGPGPEVTTKVFNVAGTTFESVLVPIQTLGRSDYMARNILSLTVDSPLASTSTTTATVSCTVLVLVRGVGVTLCGRSGRYMVPNSVVTATAESGPVFTILPEPSSLVPELAAPGSSDSGEPGYAGILAETRRPQPWVGADPGAGVRTGNYGLRAFGVYPTPSPFTTAYPTTGGLYSGIRTPNLLDHLATCHRGYYGGMTLDVAFEANPDLDGNLPALNGGVLLVGVANQQAAGIVRTNNELFNYDFPYQTCDCSSNTGAFALATNPVVSIQVPRNERGEYSLTAPAPRLAGAMEWQDTCQRPVLFRYVGRTDVQPLFMARAAADDFAWCEYRLHRAVCVFSNNRNGSLLLSAAAVTQPSQLY